MPRQDVKLRRVSPYSLVYSTLPDRSDPQLLHNAHDLAGALYIFVTPATGITSVDFYAVVGEGVSQSEAVAPYDLAGTAAGGEANPRSFTTGGNTVAAIVRSGTDVFDLVAEFTYLTALRPAITAATAAVGEVTIVTSTAATNVTVTPATVSATAAVTSPAVLTTAPANPNLKGEVATAESSLVANPNVLWVGNYGSGESNYRTLWGTTGDTHVANQSVADYSAVVGAGKNLTFRGKTVAYQSNGYGRYHYFDSMGLANGFEEAYLRYRVFFPSDYPWINSNGGGGGKLPGFAGKVGTTNRTKIPSGGNRFIGSTTCTTSNWLNADCFSARMLWLKDKRLNTYMYVPDNAHKGGASSTSYFGWATSTKVAIGSNTNFTFTPGQWHTIEQRVKMNTVGSANGIFECWVDGIKRLSVTNLIYRGSANPTLKANCIYDSWFYGGPQATYDSNGNLISLGDAPETDSFIYFDDWALGSAYIGV